jgi:hypothetical protein
MGQNITLAAKLVGLELQLQDIAPAPYDLSSLSDEALATSSDNEKPAEDFNNEDKNQ